MNVRVHYYLPNDPVMYNEIVRDCPNVPSAMSFARSERRDWRIVSANPYNIYNLFADDPREENLICPLWRAEYYRIMALAMTKVDVERRQLEAQAHGILVSPP